MFLYGLLLFPLFCAKKVGKIEESEKAETEKIIIEASSIERKQKLKYLDPLFFEYSKGKEKIDTKTFEEMFNKATAFYIDGRADDAAQIFYLLSENAPNERYRDISSFNLASSYERLGKYNEAKAAFQSLITTSNFDDIRTDSLLRIARIKISLGEFPDGLSELFTHEDLFVRIKSKALYSVWLAYNGIEEAGSITQELLSKVSSDIDDETRAAIYFARGLWFFNEAKKVILPVDAKALEEAIDSIAELILKAQVSFFETIKTKEAWWVLASLYELGNTYSTLYEQLLGQPPPDDLSDEEKRIYIEELKKSLAPALKRAREVYEKNIDFAKRLKFENVWEKKTQEQISKLDKIVSGVE